LLDAMAPEIRGVHDRVAAVLTARELEALAAVGGKLEQLDGPVPTSTAT
jgi:hypothetical protein